MTARERSSHNVMFIDLDRELFPDICEVAHLLDHDQWVYLIFKNGSCSIRYDDQLHCHILSGEDLLDLDFVDIYVRDPKERFISGINSVVQYITREHANLDMDTVTWMAARYLFLNRHYLPQILWIFNLARFIKPTCQIRLRDFGDYGRVVRLDYKPPVDPVTPHMRQQIMIHAQAAEIWWWADEILRGLIGNQMTWQQLKQYYQSKHQNVWQSLTGTAAKMSHVLS